ncbi:hypothetical protein NQ066_26260, partial [Escherichia coli]|nr:hypothetical protein [Escherichia coli]
PGKSFFSAHEVSTCKISGCLSYRILDSGPDGTQTTLTYFSPDAEFMAQVEERLGSCLTEEQRRYFDGVDSSAGIDLNSYFGREIEHFDAAPSMPEPEPEMAADPEAEQRKRVFNAIGIRY